MAWASPPSIYFDEGSIARRRQESMAARARPVSGLVSRRFLLPCLDDGGKALPGARLAAERPGLGAAQGSAFDRQRAVISHPCAVPPLTTQVDTRMQLAVLLQGSRADLAADNAATVEIEDRAGKGCLVAGNSQIERRAKRPSCVRQLLANQRPHIVAIECLGVSWLGGLRRLRVR